MTTAKDYLEVCQFTIYMFLKHIRGQDSQHFRHGTVEQLRTYVDPSVTGKLFLCRYELRRHWTVHFESGFWRHLSYLCTQITFQAIVSFKSSLYHVTLNLMNLFLICIQRMCVYTLDQSTSFFGSVLLLLAFAFDVRA